MFDRILIANRGEIACRVADTCRRLGISTVAVYSDADAKARHVGLCDTAVRVGPARAADSYLDAGAILAAASATGARAIHPGYGFLAENADFARACEAAGVSFIGPSPATMEAMGSKIEAKRLMDEAGVPTVPGYHGDNQDAQFLATQADAVGYPLLIKASAGGGGKGMRIVREAGEFASALAAARREAMSAFGDDRVLLERFVTGPRHIEFQVFGDSTGRVVHLFERECSIQRRYQKIVEETPSPFLDEDLRRRMGDAAVAAARAVDYVNAGTVEFIVSDQGEFYFMEMNTRLQVEHPVTEMVTGVDLVEWQLAVASGEALPREADTLTQQGHAIETRIYAENPDQDFLPSVGRVERFDTPAFDGVRTDTGIVSGDTITIHYDPMVAKLCVHAPDRPTAIRRLRAALANTVVAGPTTNLALLRRIAAHPAFAAGEIDTRYIDNHLDALLASDDDPPVDARIAAAARVLLDRERIACDLAEPSPWDRADGWQANGLGGSRLLLASAGHEPVSVIARGWAGRYDIAIGDTVTPIVATSGDGDGLMISMNGRTRPFRVFRTSDTLQVADGPNGWVFTLSDPYPVVHHATDEDAHPGAPMPGRIVAVHVQTGDRVEQGQPLLVLEGMKMEYTLKARKAGVVEQVLYALGDMVDAETPLVDIAPDEETVAS